MSDAARLPAGASPSIADALTPRLAPSTLFFYSLTNLPISMASIVVGVYLTKFWSSEMGVPLAMVGTIMLAIRFVDMFADPLMGYISDHTRGRFGRRRPWVLLAAPLLATSIYMLFVPPAGAGQVHLAVWGLLLGAATTMMFIPYLAWGAELSPNYNERSRVTGARAMAGVLGSLAAQVVPLVALVCCGIGRSGAVLELVGYAAAVLVPLCVVLTLWKTPEPAMSTQAQLPMFQGFVLMVKNKPFLQLVIAFMIGQVGLNITTPLYLFFITFWLKAEANTPYMLCLFFASNFLAVPFWVWLAGRIGKHRAYLASFIVLGCAHPFYMLLEPGQFWWMAPITMTTGFAAGGFSMLPESMKADVIDLDTLASGQNRAALFFSAWSFTTKVTASLGVFIATIGLSMFGFNPSAPAANGPDEFLALRLMFSTVPSLFYILGALVVWNYPINEARHAAIRAEIAAKQGAPGER